MSWFRNEYECPRCGTHWYDEWSCTCNDRCPTCDIECEPIHSVDLEVEEGVSWNSQDY